MAYTRGSSEDFDRYAAVTGDEGWSWNAILPYFKKSEKFSPPADKHNTTGEFDPTVHGFNGILGVSMAGFPTPIDPLVINATQQLGGEFSFNLDYNSGKPLGVGKDSFDWPLSADTDVNQRLATKHSVGRTEKQLRYRIPGSGIHKQAESNGPS